MPLCMTKINCDSARLTTHDMEIETHQTQMIGLTQLPNIIMQGEMEETVC